MNPTLSPSSSVPDHELPAPAAQASVSADQDIGKNEIGPVPPVDDPPITGGTQPPPAAE